MNQHSPTILITHERRCAQGVVAVKETFHGFVHIGNALKCERVEDGLDDFFRVASLARDGLDVDRRRMIDVRREVF
ncbi:hypothetical protein ASG41_17460 [Modestobacter sp. Leaf380]|nr:hypothetical protein ASG41_17460 [Modestobacter sp. Leaf380]